MSTQSFTGTTVIASLRYHDPPAAIEWLCLALGFSRHAVYAGPESMVAHAQLTRGSGMIMLGSSGNHSPYKREMVHPWELEDRYLPPIYLAVPDCDPVWRCVQEAKAEIVLPLETMEYGGRAFTVRDPEGYLWSVGEYDPWSGEDQNRSEDAC